MIQPVDRYVHRKRLMRVESRVRGDHPLRPIQVIVNGALPALSADFEAIYAAGIGRPSIPPERLLRALLLQAFYGIRSERHPARGRSCLRSDNLPVVAFDSGSSTAPIRQRC
jgi:transposase